MSRRAGSQRPARRKHEPFDVTGRKIHVGDCVRIVGVPDLSAWRPEQRAETEPVFEHLVGRYQQVAGFDRYGHVELEFSIRKGEHAGLHWVWIEPYLLRVRRTRSPRSET